ncbi:Annexin A7 [Daldinia childiae]|uniref:Annexin A7 n=1 Tax=Daldinia childiae TaxID=326645 RepID=UPI001448360A|nr:Annexin A7 [Daldinia childiae]KAF3065899.1 Annexin A7 [Daldinia childiae]
MDPQKQHYYYQFPPTGGPPDQPGQSQPGYQQPPPGASYYPPAGPPVPGQPPYQQQPYSFYNTPQGPPQNSQYQQQSQQYPSGPPRAPGQYTLPQPYPSQQPQQGQYEKPPVPYHQWGPSSRQSPPHITYPQAPIPYSLQPQQHGGPLGVPQWPQPQPQPQYSEPGYGYGVPPTPASPGYDLAQRAFVAPVDTSADVEALRKAMKGMGCDEAVLVRVLTSSKYENPWAMAQLVGDYNKRFIRDLAKDIESETRGGVETALLALIRGPLEQDVRVLIKALDRAGTDEDALMDVLLCRSNADIRAINAEYKRIKGNELLVDIKDDVDDTLFRLYSMVLSATRAEDAAPVISSDIDQKVTELQRATEGTIGANAISVAQIFTNSNTAQLQAISKAYERKYHRSFEEVIEKEFRGDMEDALLYMLENAIDRARFDAKRLERPLYKTPRKDRLLINRVVSLYWNRPRQDMAKAAYQVHSSARTSLRAAFKGVLSGDYEDLMIALIRERK